MFPFHRVRQKAHYTLRQRSLVSTWWAYLAKLLFIFVLKTKKRSLHFVDIPVQQHPVHVSDPELIPER